MMDTKEKYYLARNYTDTAKGIAWDTCHKVYILMDDEQVELMRSYGYGKDDPKDLITSDQLNPSELATVAMTWYNKACGLRFIQAVYSDERGFVDVIGQFEDIDDDDDYTDDDDDDYNEDWR